MAKWVAPVKKQARQRLVHDGDPSSFAAVPCVEEAAGHEYSPSEQLIIDGRTSGQIVGGPETVRAGLATLVHETQADELMITAMIHGYDDRLRSYELVADLARNSAKPAGAASCG